MESLHLSGEPTRPSTSNATRPPEALPSWLRPGAQSPWPNNAQAGRSPSKVAQRPGFPQYPPLESESQQAGDKRTRPPSCSSTAQLDTVFPARQSRPVKRARSSMTLRAHTPPASSDATSPADHPAEGNETSNSLPDLYKFASISFSDHKRIGKWPLDVSRRIFEIPDYADSARTALKKLDDLREHCNSMQDFGDLTGYGAAISDLLGSLRCGHGNYYVEMEDLDVLDDWVKTGTAPQPVVDYAMAAKPSLVNSPDFRHAVPSQLSIRAGCRLVTELWGALGAPKTQGYFIALATEKRDSDAFRLVKILGILDYQKRQTRPGQWKWAHEEKDMVRLVTRFVARRIHSVLGCILLAASHADDQRSQEMDYAESRVQKWSESLEAFLKEGIPKFA
ncbi:hypothetical protein B0T16DRAFT_222242 [Cercophora newfieldiana]|uniref:Uncharacterized protein n=1 Tax=Cercophora newfieldiana TaxID=92897 RepID=A0AA40CM15_9PEZI|nr:hypothetical protein B0T16DRAFT_222242 [Cercophora newfieldiana]